MTETEEESKVQEVADSSVMEASEVNQYDDRRLERVQKLLDNLDSTQDSIVGASTLIIQICGKAPSFAQVLVSLIMKERIPEAACSAQVSLIYLANDLIQRSKIRQKGSHFWKLFQPLLEDTLINMFGL